jgi:hypothetical protein
VFNLQPLAILGNNLDMPSPASLELEGTEILPFSVQLPMTNPTCDRFGSPASIKNASPLEAFMTHLAVSASHF